MDEMMLPFPIQDLTLITFSLFAHRFKFPMDLPYSLASPTIYPTNNTNSTIHREPVKLSRTGFWKQNFQVSREFSPSQVCPLVF